MATCPQISWLRPVPILVVVGVLLLGVGVLWHCSCVEQHADSAGSGADKAPRPQLPVAVVTELGHPHGPSPQSTHEAVPASPAKRGDAVVRVVGDHGQPLPAVRIVVQGLRGHDVQELFTDEGGCVSLKDLPFDGSIRVYADLWKARLDAVPVDGPEIELDVLGGKQAMLHLLDAETGKPCRFGRWMLDRSAYSEYATCKWVHVGQRMSIVSLVGFRNVFWLHLRDVRTGIAWDTHWFGFHPSPYARALVVRYPIRREARVMVRLNGRGGAGVEEPCVPAFRIALGAGTSAGLEARVGDVWRLRGLPFYRETGFAFLLTDRSHGDEVRGLLARRAPECASRPAWHAGLASAIPHAVTVSSRLPRAPTDSLWISAVLPEEGQEGARWAGSSPWPVRLACRPSLYDEQLHSGLVQLQRPRGPDVATIHVRRRNGCPATSARVRFLDDSTLVNTDDQGRVYVRRPMGEHETLRILLVEPGMVQTQISLGGHTDVRKAILLKEGLGGDVLVHVLDEDGDDLSFARLWLHTATHNVPTCWEDEAAGIQRIDHFTDHRGRRLYRHVDPGRATVQAVWGDRYGKAAVDVIEGRTAEVQIVLRRTR